MVKLLGYVFSLLGAACLILSVEKFYSKIPSIQFVPSFVLMMIGGGLIIVGIIFLKGSVRRQAKEVPIYEGKKIVGYRRG